MCVTVWVLVAWCDPGLFSWEDPCFLQRTQEQTETVTREIGSCWITASSVAGAGRYHVKEVGKFVGRKRQGSARHVGKKIHLSTRRYEKWLIFLRSHANRLWGDWRTVEYGQLQKKSMDSLLWVYWIVRPPLSQTGHLNKEHFWIYLLFVIKCP